MSHTVRYRPPSTPSIWGLIHQTVQLPGMGCYSTRLQARQQMQYDEQLPPQGCPMNSQIQDMWIRPSIMKNPKTIRWLRLSRFA